MKPTGEIWIWAVALLKQAEVCARYHINAGRYGNVYIVVDMELKGRIREALIKMILGFDIEDMDLEPEE